MKFLTFNYLNTSQSNTSLNTLSRWQDLLRLEHIAITTNTKWELDILDPLMTKLILYTLDYSQMIELQFNVKEKKLLRLSKTF